MIAPARVGGVIGAAGGSVVQRLLDEALDLVRQFEISCRDPFAAMGQAVESDPGVPDLDVRVMADLFRDLRDDVDEVDRLEVFLKIDDPPDRPAVLSPLRQVAEPLFDIRL